MPRKPRIHYKGALYHVMARGNNRESVLEHEQDKQKYLDLVRKYKARYEFKLYAYCIMDNHVHMLIEVADTPLSKIMQGVQQSFTQSFNKRYERTGHVFQQRYKANLCDKENYFLQAIKYIHYNPVKASLNRGIDYKWSSHKDYLKNDKNSLVDKDFPLSIFSKDSIRALKLYLKFMNEPDDDIEAASFTLSERPDGRHEKTDIDEREIITIDQLITEILQQENVTLEKLISKNRTQKIVDVRKAIVLLSEEFCREKSVDIAKRLNISLSLVSKIKCGETKETAYLLEIMEKYKRENKWIIQA